MIERWCKLSCRDSIISIHSAGHPDPTFNVWNPPCGSMTPPIGGNLRVSPPFWVLNLLVEQGRTHWIVSVDEFTWVYEDELFWDHFQAENNQQPFPHSKTTLWKDRSIVKSLHRWRGSAVVDTIAGLTNLNLHCWEPANAQSELRFASPGVGVTQKTGTATLRVPFKANCLSSLNLGSSSFSKTVAQS